MLHTDDYLYKARATKNVNIILNHRLPFALHPTMPPSNRHRTRHEMRYCLTSCCLRTSLNMDSSHQAATLMLLECVMLVELN